MLVSQGKKKVNRTEIYHRLLRLYRRSVMYTRNKYTEGFTCPAQLIALALHVYVTSKQQHEYAAEAGIHANAR